MPWPWFKEYGLFGLVMGSVVALLFFVVKWTLATTREILNQAAIERQAWQKAIVEHTEQANLFRQSVTEAHNYQRQEHERFAEKQNESNNAMGLICQNLASVKEALGRINGYNK